MDHSKDVTLEGRSATLPSSSYVSPDRFSLPFHFRIAVTTLGVFLAGMCLGAPHGSRTAGLVFRAENSHRFPDTSAGWYLYHKSKNYQMMYGGVKEAFRMGSKVAFWAGGFFIVEEAIDRVRSRTDFMSTVVAGLGVAGGFSVWNRFPIATAARTARTGLYGGLAFGLIQDAISLARGRHLAYADFLLGRNRYLREANSKAI